MAERLQTPAVRVSSPMRPAVAWLWLLLLLATAVAALLPHLAHRQTADWERWRGPRAGLPLSPAERIYQLNWDIPGWLELIADFPAYYYSSNERINRPLYPATAAAVCRMAQALENLAPSMLLRPCTIPAAYAAAIAVNWAALALATFGMYWLLLHWRFSDGAAFLGAAHLTLAPLVIWVLGSSSPEMMALALAVATLWLYTRCYEAPTDGYFWLAAATGLVAGMFMLEKGHYEILAVAWLALIVSGRWRAAAISFVFHLLPLALWLALLRLMGLTYYNVEVDRYDQVVWLWREFIYLPLPEQVGLLWQHTRIYAWNFNTAFGPLVLIVTGLGCWQLARRRAFGPLALVVTAVIVSWAFLFAIRRPLYYLITMCFYVVYPLAAWFVAGQIERYSGRVRRLALAVYIVLTTAAAWYYSNAGRYAIIWGGY